jgi:hypothetical protein
VYLIVGEDENGALKSLLLLPVEVAVDADRNGEIQFGSDRTSAEKPFRFWINNDQDDVEIDEPARVEDGSRDMLDSVIKTKRDLEDFVRMKIALGIPLEQLKDGTFEIGLKFKDSATGSPAIRIWPNESATGKSDFLTNGDAAGRQIGKTSFGATTSGTVFLPASFWEQQTKAEAHLIFEGISTGKGELALVVKPKDGAETETTGIHLHLLDVREMYERARITPDHPDQFTEPSQFVGVFGNPSIMPPVPNIGWEWHPDGKAFVEDPEENKEYLVFVHGWNMTNEGSQRYAESMFKRLWQKGYKGRYAFVRWPTYTGWLTYNASDYRAWLSGIGVAAFVNSLPPSHTKNIAAHSMGNIVVSSALREGMQVDNYALLNAAIPAMCFDVRESLYEFAGRETPDGDDDPITRALGFKGKISDDNVRRSMINFYLKDDSALTGLIGDFLGWEHNNAFYKPESFGLIAGYGYDSNREAGTKVHLDFWTEFGRHLRSFPESAAYATASKTKAVGAESRTVGVINDNLNMNTEYGFGSTHSAQWIWNMQKTHQFYYDLMSKFNLKPIR